MPELPEVETIARGLAKRVTGDVIVSVWLGQKKEPLKSPAAQIAKALEGSRISSVRRMGKHIVFDLDPAPEAQKLSHPKSKSRRRSTSQGLANAGHGLHAASHVQWIVHLGMTGSLRVCEPQTEIAKHTHAILSLDSGMLLYDDIRQFGRLELSQGLPARVRKLGPEPLEIPVDAFAALMRKRKSRIKALLLNQSFLRGVGNIYADESLFRAGIHPLAIAARLRKDRVERLHKALTRVLREAIEAGGSSISDYVDIDGRQGSFQVKHNVYQRTGEPCVKCGNPIRRILVSQRGTHFCPKCQRR